MEQERKNLMDEKAREVADRRRMCKTQSPETGNPHPHPVKRLFLQLATQPKKTTEIQNLSSGVQQKEYNINEQEKTQSPMRSEINVGVGDDVGGGLVVGGEQVFDNKIKSTWTT